jgi:myosin heavy subunit
MKIQTAIVFLSLLVCSSAGAEEFTTSHGLRSVLPLNGLASLNSAQQAQQEGVTALSELMADAIAVDNEGTGLLAEAATLRQKVDAEKKALDPARSHYEATSKKYQADMASYDERNDALGAESVREQSEATALQAVVSAQRDQATVDRLNKWAADIDARSAALKEERGALEEQQKVVEAERLNIVQLEATASAKLKVLSDALQAKYAARKARQTAVYGQIRRCAAYVGKVRELLQTKFNVPARPLPVLDGAIARVKEFDARAK